MSENKEKVWLPYIDTIKGIAIFLVVMGHAIAWQFSNGEFDFEAITNGNKKVLFWWLFIYSFHMPLFFLVSGYLSPKKIENHKEFGLIIWKKTKALLIPFIVSSMALTLIMGGGNYWFLKTLFLFSCIGAVGDYLRSKTSKGFLFDIIYFATIFSFLRLIVKVMPQEVADAIGMNSMNAFNFSAFMIGTFLRKYSRLLTLFENKVTYAIALLAFVVLFSLNIKNIDINIFWLIPWSITPLSAIIVVWFLCKYVWTSGKTIQILQLLGKHSLEIYILHFYFCVKPPLIGAFITEKMSSTTKIDISTGAMVQLVVSFTVSCIIVVLCFIFLEIIRANPFLSRALFGRK